jgi:hypothetical protein
MLAKKIQSLLEDDHPPEWFRDLDPEYLRVIGDLGNAAIHPNEGDVAVQRAFDETVVLQVRMLFVELLDDIYEQPDKKAARLAALKDVRDSFNRRSEDATTE